MNHPALHPLPLDRTTVRPLLRPRPSDGHKGTFGHLLIIAGSYGMAGAAILATRAALRSGLGKVTLHTSERCVNIIQTAVPEALTHLDEHSDRHWAAPIDLTPFQAAAIGPGIGQDGETQWALRTQLQLFNTAKAECRNCPLVIDADALNLVASDYQLLALLPPNTVLTPHPGEMMRLCQALDLPHDTPEALHASAHLLAHELQLVVVLKSHHTLIALPDGTTHLNTAQGNSGMGTAGSGDVLTGLLGGLLAQGYRPDEAARLAVYLHATAGDIAARKLGEHSLIASDLIENLGSAFQSLDDKHL